MKKIYIVHGYLANVNSHWFDWIKQNVATQGYEVTVLAMSDSAQPKYADWYSDLEEGLSSLQADDIVIAHSLGCISTLDYLSKLQEQNVFKKLILVSGFYEKLSVLPDLDQFVESCTLDTEKLQALVGNITVFVSSNDVLVQPELTYRLAEKLNANVVNVKNAGHFLDSDGYTTFPDLLAAI